MFIFSATSNRRVLQYGDQLLAQLPIKALVREAQKEQLLYAGLFAPLLKYVIYSNCLSGTYTCLCIQARVHDQTYTDTFDILNYI